MSLTSADWSTCRAHRRYDEAADAYEEGLKTSPGDAALGRGLEDVLKAQAASKAPAGELAHHGTCSMAEKMEMIHDNGSDPAIRI